MDREQAYVSSIPQSAREEVVKVLSDEGGEAWQYTEYYIGPERVGLRFFHPCGALETEYAFLNGAKHGWQYRWDKPGRLLSAAPWENGVQHGTAYQWADDGRLIGSYTMDQGTGLDLWRQDWSDGTVDLAEVHPYLDGQNHGFEWWFCEYDRLWVERHWVHGVLHGIEREWNFEGGISRGFPRYWLHGKRVTKPQYVRALERGVIAPPFKREENKPFREFPPEVTQHLRRTYSQRSSTTERSIHMTEVKELEALVFTAPGETEIRRFPMLAMGPKEVMTRTLYTMVSSGTELRVFAGRGEAEGKFPLVPGYVAIGEVIQVGSEVEGYRPGDLILGRNSGRALPGVELVYGGQQSHHVYPATGSVQPILLPEGAMPLDYVPAELAAISGRGVQMAAPRPGETAIVVGQGLIGGLSAAWLAAAGCRVIALDIETYRLERAVRWGVAATINVKDENPVARVAALCPDGADIVVDASANPEGLKLACSLLRPESPLVIRTPAWPRLVIQASYKGEVPMHPNGFFPGEGVLVLTPGDRRLADRVAAMEAIRDGRLDSSAFLDEITSYRNAPEAYLRLRDHPDSVFSLVFDWTA